MDTLLFAINAISPLIFLIILGYCLKRIGFLEETWLRTANKFVFKIALPCLLFMNVYQIESFSSIDWSIVIYSEIMIFALFFLGLFVVKIAVRDSRQKGVILQCMFRSNFAIIGIPLAESLGGMEAKGIAAILSAFSIPTFNILAVIALNLYSPNTSGSSAHFKKIIKNILTNPLIIGVTLGLFLLAIRSVLPVTSENVPIFMIKNNLPGIYTSINNIGKIASPLALIVLGGLFDFSAVAELKKQILLGTIARVVFAPAFAISCAIMLSEYTSILNFHTQVYPALLALFGSPIAVASAVMAQEMDNDSVLAGQLVVWTSISSIFTLFFFILILKSLGFF